MADELQGIKRYADLMKEIRTRVQLIEVVEARTQNESPLSEYTEVVYLQFRKVLELIAFASLCANEKAYAKAYADFATHWSAKKLLRGLSKVNPEFYPQPVVEQPPPLYPAKSSLVPKVGGFLTKDDFVALYDVSSSMIHAPNPFAKPPDYAHCRREARRWRGLIYELLDFHQIVLVGDPHMYTFQMNVAGDDEVHYNQWKKMIGRVPT